MKIVLALLATAIVVGFIIVSIKAIDKIFME